MPSSALLQVASRPDRVAGGHRLCTGCGAGVIIRQMLLATDERVVGGKGTRCVEVCTSVSPYTAWRVPWIHNGFENAAATISGVEAAYKAMKRRGDLPRLEPDGRPIKVVGLGGEG